MVILLYSILETGINQLTETSTMLKLPLMLINFIGLFFLHFFSVSEITIQNMAPSTLAPGEKVLVEVSIDKAAIQGFAKMEIVFPEGFIATPAETAGASFTFSEKNSTFGFFFAQKLPYNFPNYLKIQFIPLGYIKFSIFRL